MPLFKDKKTEPPPTTTTTTTGRTSTSSKSGGFFGRRGSSPANTSPAPTTSTNTSTSRGGLGGLLHRDREDPSISDARERVMKAEAAERDADRALVQARQAVKDAREHVHRLEAEAREEARLAKIKQEEAAKIGKRANPLGRHDKV